MVVVGISAQTLGLRHMDAVAAIVVAAMIVLMGYRLGRNALNELIDTGLDFDLVDDLRASMLGDKSVIGIHNLRTRSMGGLGYVDAHIEVDSDLTVSEAHYIAHRIEYRVKKQFPQIVDVQIHIDPLDDAVKESVLAKLPERSVIEADLERAWADNRLGSAIEQIKLHYLDELIEIDLVLPLSLGRGDNDAAIEQLQQAAAELGYVGRVNLLYTDKSH